jgi:hypothetical protein
MEKVRKLVFSLKKTVMEVECKLFELSW